MRRFMWRQSERAAHQIFHAPNLNRRLPGGRVLSRSRPSTPSVAKPSCQRRTQVFDLPVAAMIAFVRRRSHQGAAGRRRRE